MSRYIDADKMKSELLLGIATSKTLLPPSIYNDTARAVRAFIKLLDEFETTDVRENVKGEWIDCLEDDIVDVQICSVCGYKEYVIDKPNFCPNCGADMRGEENAE